MPVGTHTGWNPRKDGAAGGDLASLSGSFVPFALTKVEREAAGDPRLSIEERYGTHAGYVSAIVRAAESLLSEGLLLTEDADRYIDAANERDPLDADVPLLPLTLSRSIPEVL